MGAGVLAAQAPACPRRGLDKTSDNNNSSSIIVIIALVAIVVRSNSACNCCSTRATVAADAHGRGRRADGVRSKYGTEEERELYRMRCQFLCVPTCLTVSAV